MTSAMVPAGVTTANALMPASYERAKVALSECARIDECMDWANKAQALASYAKQADDDTMYKMALRIQARAVRRCGELLKTFQSSGGRPAKTTDCGDGSFPRSQKEAARNAGMSERQELTAVRVSNIPESVFDASLDADGPPTVTKLAEMGKSSRPTTFDIKPPSGFAHATSAIGTLRSFAEFCAAHDPVAVAGGVYDFEVAQIRRHVVTVDAWLDTFIVNLKGQSSEQLRQHSRG